MTLKDIFWVEKMEMKVKIIRQQLYVQVHNVKKRNNG